MPVNTELYSSVENRFKAWMTDRDEVGDDIANVPLDYLNRARQALWGMTFLDDLMKDVELTVTDRKATLPSDYGKTYEIYSDSDGDDKADWHYFSDGKYGRGYTLRKTYTIAAGSSFEITWYKDPERAVRIKYMQSLADFAGTGTEFIFFPAELLLKKAQLIFKEDADDGDRSYDVLKNAFNELWDQYVWSHQFVNRDMKMEQNDARGNVVLNESYDLLDGGDNQFIPFDNSTDNPLI